MLLPFDRAQYHSKRQTWVFLSSHQALILLTDFHGSCFSIGRLCWESFINTSCNSFSVWKIRRPHFSASISCTNEMHGSRIQYQALISCRGWIKSAMYDCIVQVSSHLAGENILNLTENIPQKHCLPAKILRLATEPQIILVFWGYSMPLTKLTQHFPAEHPQS